MDYYKILNKNVIKILDVLKKDRFYFNQIYELTKIKSKNNLLKNLNSLVNHKILNRDKNKGNTFYSLNYENQFTLALLQLININQLYNLPFERRKAIIDLVNSTKPLIAVLFGSTAKNNFKKNSDIDILLIYNSKIRNIDNHIQEVGSKYGIKINAIILKFLDVNRMDSSLKHIFKTGYPVTGYSYFYEVLKDV